MSYNIFDLYKKGSKETISSNVAVLKNKNMTNRFREISNTANRKSKEKINLAFEKIGIDNKLDVPENWEISNKINEDIARYNEFNKDSLIELFKEELAEKANCPGENNEEKITANILNEAAKQYEIDEGLPAKFKARMIKKKYEEEIYQLISKKLKKADEEELKKFEIEINKQLDTIDKKELESIKNKLQVDNLTGEVIRKALLSSSGPLSLMALVQISGFSSYILLTTVMHAISTSILGITLPFAAYTGATSALAFLSGPFALIIATGLTGWQIVKGSNKMNRLLLAKIISTAIIIDETEVKENYNQIYLKSGSGTDDNKAEKNINYLLPGDYEGYSENEESETINFEKNLWLKFFDKFNEFSSKELSNMLDNIKEFDQYWDETYIKIFEKAIMDLVLNNCEQRDKRLVLEKALWQFGDYITSLNPENNEILINSKDVYAGITFGLDIYVDNKNDKKTKRFINLLENMLISYPGLNDSICSEVLGKNNSDWFEKPVYNKSIYFLDMLELFDDFGCNKKRLKEEWTKWISIIYKKVKKLSDNELELWLRIGNEVNGRKYYIEKIKNELERRKEVDFENKTKDCLKEIKDIKFAIFTLRKDPARRVKNKLERKNENIEVIIISDKKLTDRAVSHANNSIGIVASDSIKHASIKGLKDCFKNNRYPFNPIYPRSGGESAILDEIELYAEKYLC